MIRVVDIPVLNIYNPSKLSDLEKIMANYDEIVEYLQNRAKFNKVFDNRGELDEKNALTFAKEIYKNAIPGFFTPFQSGKDLGINFGLALASPIYIPLLLGTLTAVLAIAAAITAATFIGGLLFAVASLASNTEMAVMGLALGIFSGAICAGCIAGILGAAIGLLVAVPATVLQFITRATASIPTLLCDAPEDEKKSMVFAF